MGIKVSKSQSFFERFGSVRYVQPNRNEIKKAIQEKKLFTILMQGAGESGKSTILKQMRLSQGKGFDSEYKLLQGKKIIASLLRAIIRVLESCDIEDNNMKAKLLSQVYSVINSDANMQKDLAKSLCELAKDEEFLKLYELDKDNLPQNMLEMMSKFASYPKWGGNKWLPSTEEILCGRSRTVGVNKSVFRATKRLFEVIDVGGQKNQRQKYIHLFDNIDQIIFVASLSDYNLKLWESPSEDRLQDSLNLFKQVVNRPQWSNASIVLFLNKFDLFQNKYNQEKIPLPNLGPNYPLPPVVEDETDKDLSLAVSWFQNIYLSQINPGRLEKDDVQVTIAIEVEFMSSVITKLIANIARQIVQEFPL